MSDKPTNETSVTPPASTPITVAPKTTSGVAIAALVVGIVAFVIGWFPVLGFIIGVVAIVLGIISLRKPGGTGFGIVGIVGGGLGALWSLVGTIVVTGTIFSSIAAFTQINSLEEFFSSDQGAMMHELRQSQKEFTKGETAIIGNSLELKADNVQRNFQFSNPTSSELPKEGEEFILVTLSITNISQYSQLIAPTKFEVTDGYTTSGLPRTMGYDNPLGNTTLEPGESITANLVFEITKDATDLKLRNNYVADDGTQKKQFRYTLGL